MFRSAKDVTAALGVSRYYIESFVKGLGFEQRPTGRRRCDQIQSIIRVHKDRDGHDIPVIRRRPWYYRPK